MELKDVILSTLAEMEEVNTKPPADEFEIKETINVKEQMKQELTKPIKQEELPIEKDSTAIDSELMYLTSIKERLLVLFEGFQAPNNTNIEAKVDMTLNFLEYTLSTIETRVELLEKGKK